MLKEFKEFALRGNVIDLAVGIIIGAAFNDIVNSLVDDIIMPPIGLLTAGISFEDLFIPLDGGSYQNLAEAQAANAPTLNYGLFINNLVNFLIIAFVVFLLVRWINRLRRNPEENKTPNTKACPYCQSTISIKATRCPECTSHLEGEPGTGTRTYPAPAD